MSGLSGSAMGVAGTFGFLWFVGGSWVRYSSFWFIHVRPGGLWFLRVRLVHSGAPWESMGSLRFVGTVRVRHVGRWVPFHSFGTSEYVLVCRWIYLVSFVSSGCALGVAEFFWFGLVRPCTS